MPLPQDPSSDPLLAQAKSVVRDLIHSAHAFQSAIDQPTKLQQWKYLQTVRAMHVFERSAATTHMDPLSPSPFAPDSPRKPDQTHSRRPARRFYGISTTTSTALDDILGHQATVIHPSDTGSQPALLPLLLFDGEDVLESETRASGGCPPATATAQCDDDAQTEMRAWMQWYAMSCRSPWFHARDFALLHVATPFTMPDGRRGFAVAIHSVPKEEEEEADSVGYVRGEIATSGVVLLERQRPSSREAWNKDASHTAVVYVLCVMQVDLRGHATRALTKQFALRRMGQLQRHWCASNLNPTTTSTPGTPRTPQDRTSCAVCFRKAGPWRRMRCCTVCLASVCGSSSCSRTVTNYQPRVDEAPPLSLPIDLLHASEDVASGFLMSSTRSTASIASTPGRQRSEWSSPRWSSTSSAKGRHQQQQQQRERVCVDCLVARVAARRSRHSRVINRSTPPQTMEPNTPTGDPAGDRVNDRISPREHEEGAGADGRGARPSVWTPVLWARDSLGARKVDCIAQDTVVAGADDARLSTTVSGGGVGSVNECNMRGSELRLVVLTDHSCIM